MSEDFEYTIKPKPTKYNGVEFRSRLEAKWAAFFDLGDLEWIYEPIDKKNWVPDFWLEIPCNHSECSNNHELYIEVKPYTKLTKMEQGEWISRHPDFARRPELPDVDPWSIPSPAIFGQRPDVTRWIMTHGAGGGVEDIKRWVKNADKLWKEASNKTKWEPNQG